MITERIKEYIKSKPKMKKLAIKVYGIVWINFLRNIIHRVGIFFPNSKYRKIRMLRNKYDGQSCIIVATGPSLKYEDLDVLEKSGIMSFSMNSIIKAFESTSWRPDFYGIQDPDVYRVIKENIGKAGFKGETFFFYNSELRDFPKDNAYSYYLNYLGHGMGSKFWHKGYKFSTNVEKEIFDGYSISFSILQIAVYLGFKTIFILGLDANIPMTGKTHFIEYMDEKHINRTRGTEQAQIIAFDKSRPKLEEKGVRVINITRGGCLDCFERMDFDKVAEKGFMV